ncbi:hypothetical protein F1880_009043 [Penicillium rolfsii]|nr:hypothetical protein F1880_009043 [Penicillium rolfsii]
MVGVPRSKGCLACLQRRIKCDENFPSCKHCKRRGLRCPGYNRPRKFYHFLGANQQGTTSGLPQYILDDSASLKLNQTASMIQHKEALGLFVDTTFPGLYYAWSSRVDVNFIDFACQQDNSSFGALMLGARIWAPCT